MLYQEERFKKLVKVIFWLMGAFLLIGLFTLFNGGKNNPSSRDFSVNDGGAEEQSISPNRSFSSMSYDMGSNGTAEKGMNLTSPTNGDSDTISVEPETTIMDRKMVKNGNVSLMVGDTEWAVEEVSKIAREKGGEVFTTNLHERVKGQKSGFVTIKVPVDKFEETIKEVKKIATQVLSESTTGQDVTEQYVDLQAQLKNKRAEEESFVKILGTAGKIEDALAATKEVSRVRGEIERLEGKIRLMESQTEMSTITVDLSEDVEVAPIGEGWRPWEVVKKSFKELIDNIQDFADGVIRFIIVGIPSLIPFVLLAAFFFWAGKKIFKKINL
ncbi:MAG: DUF4349 domain-containing protein [Candidatus Moraniibacteriota bacterium]